MLISLEIDTVKKIVSILNAHPEMSETAEMLSKKIDSAEEKEAKRFFLKSTNKDTLSNEIASVVNEIHSIEKRKSKNKMTAPDILLGNLEEVDEKLCKETAEAYIARYCNKDRMVRQAREAVEFYSCNKRNNGIEIATIECRIAEKYGVAQSTVADDVKCFRWRIYSILSELNNDKYFRNR